MKTTAELMPDHPILILRAAETRHKWGIHNGEPLAFRCVECGCCDEDVSEIIHEEDCRLSGQTKPTAYADRIQSFDESEPASDGSDPDRWLATDGGRRD